MAGGGQIGNNNATKNQPWRDAMNWALKNHSSNSGKEVSKVEESTALRDIATKCIDNALLGDKDARKEIGDRLDGRPSQAIVGDPDQPLAILINKMMTEE